MMMLNTGGDEGTEKTILNCFRKSWISVEAQTGAMNDHDDPFKEIMNYGEDGSAVEELEFYLNQLHKTRPDLTRMRFPTNPFHHHREMKLTGQSKF